MGAMRRVLGWLLCATACGGPAATVAITNPTSGATVALGSDARKSLAVNFTATNFTIRAPGTCSGAAACGQAYILIDGAACDPVGQPYNNLAVSSPGTAQFSTCATPTGPHTLSVELHYDDGSSVKGADGKPVAASVSVTTT